MFSLASFFRRLGISEHEGARFKISWTMRFLYQVGFVLAWTMITALFVEHFGIHNLLWLFIFEAILLMFGSILARGLVNRLSLQLYSLYGLGLALLFLTGALFFPSQDVGFFLCLILAKDLFFYQVSIALYRRGEEMFSPQEAQKMMPFIESAMTIGTIVGAAVTVWAVDHLLPEYVLTLWGGILLLMGGIAYLTPKWLHDIPEFLKPQEHSEETTKGFLGCIKDLKKVPFLRYIALFIFLQSAIFAVVEYEFTKDVQSHIMHQEHHYESAGLPNLQASLFSDVKDAVVEFSHATKEKAKDVYDRLIVHETLAHDLGMLHLLFGLLALFVQLVLTPKLLHRLGVVGSMISYIVIMLVSMGGLLLGYGNIQILRAVQHGFHSFSESGYHISFYSWFHHRRESIRLLLEGIIKPLGMIAGALFVLGGPEVSSLWGVLGAIVIMSSLYRPLAHYFTKLSDKNLEQSDQLISEKCNAIEVLGQSGHHNAAGILIKELSKHQLDRSVRKKIIKTLGTIGSPEVVHLYNHILLDANETNDIKIEVLQSLLNHSKLNQYWQQHAFGQYHLIHTLESLFKKEKHPHLRKLLIMNLFRHMPTHKVVPFFLETMQTDDKHLRAICLRCCTLFDDPDIIHYLYPYLEDKDPMIQGHAIIAMWRYGDHHTLRGMIRELLYKKDPSARIAAIYAIGELADTESKHLLYSFLHAPEEDIKIHTLIALAKLRDLTHIDHLLRIIFEGETELSQRAYHMLDRLPEDLREHIQELVRAEVSRRIMDIVQEKKLSHFPDLRQLPKQMINHLKRLYVLGEKYDCLLALNRL